MYCVKCGVELQKGTQKCPLCGLKVWHPDITEEVEPSPYPEYTQKDEDRRSTGVMVIITLLTLIPVIICVLIDLLISHRIVWSGFVAGGISTAYMFVVFPFWFRNRNPVILFPAASVVAILYLLYICLKTKGHWFLPFAFPAGSIFIVILETTIVLLKYTVKGKTHRIATILGSEFIATGAACVLIEFLIHISFGFRMTWWSLIPMSVQLIVGIISILIGTNRNIRSAFYKKFFI